MEKDLEYYKLMFVNKGALSHEDIEDIQKAGNWLIKQVEKVERYEKALKFYANKDYYEPFREDEEDRTDAFNFIDLDGGATAREALKEKEFYDFVMVNVKKSPEELEEEQ